MKATLARPQPGYDADISGKRAAVVRCDGWAGRYDIPVEVIGETPTRYRVRVLAAARWPGRNRSVAPGDIKLCPRHVVLFLSPSDRRY